MANAQSGLLIVDYKATRLKFQLNADCLGRGGGVGGGGTLILVLTGMIVVTFRS